MKEEEKKYILDQLDKVDDIGEKLLDELRGHVEAYGKSPAGRKYFYGDHLK